MSTEQPAPDRGSRADFLARLSVPRARSHNHRPLDDLLRELRVGPVERLLLWLSKTDVYVLALSSHHTRLTLVSLGMMVLFTSLLAFCSGLYALLDGLVAPDSPARWPIALVLAGLYAFGIMIIDREIVGSSSMKSMPVRFLFALGIATAVSWPVKVKFFEGRIQAETVAMIEERNLDKQKRIDELKKTGEPERRDRRAQIEKRIAALDKDIAVLQVQIEKEAGIVRCDVRCQALRAQQREQLTSRKAAEDELANLASPPTLPADVRKEVDRLENDIAAQRKNSYDFLSKWEAMNRIKADPKMDYEILSWFVFGFFMLLELVPMALKWSLGKTEYHYYIEARSNLNNQKIIAVNNVFMDLMQHDPRAVLEVLPLEITDLIAAVMEDESLNTGDEPRVQQLISAMRRAAPARPDDATGASGHGVTGTDSMPPVPHQPGARNSPPQPAPPSPGHRDGDTLDDPLAPRG